jgi:hypothetical protein
MCRVAEIQLPGNLIRLHTTKLRIGTLEKTKECPITTVPPDHYPTFAAPLDSTVSEDGGIEPRTVGTLALTVRRSNHSATSRPQLG